MIRRLAIACAVAVAVAMVHTAPAAARPRGQVHGLPLPPGSRVANGDRFVSGRGFRRTVEYYQRLLARRGVRHDALPVYRYRGTVVARFIARQTGARWSALHVYQSAGKTYVYVVPATPLTSRARHGNERVPRLVRDRLTAGPVPLEHVI